MFKIQALPAYFHTVSVRFPMGNDEVKVVEFDAQFRRLTQDEIEELNASVVEGRITDREIIDRVLMGWRNVGDAEGNELPYTPENLESLLRLHPTKPSIVRAYFGSLEAARAKN